MNRFLAGTLNILNAFAAIIIISGFALAGLNSAGAVGAILLGVVGIVIAGMFCGIISILVLIENHLRKISGNEQAVIKTIKHHERTEPGL